MNIYVMMDPDYKDTYWCRQTVNGILEETSKKKYGCILLQDEQPETIDWDQLFDNDKRLLIVVGTSVAWIPGVLSHLQKNKVQVILVSLQPPTGFTGVSTILMDHVDTTRSLLYYLSGLGKKRIALYGINPNSSADELKVDCFRSFLQESTGEDCTERIFYNYASLSDCYRQFALKQKHQDLSFDAAICANDVVAISLIRHLEKDGHRVPEDLYLVSFGDTLMARLFSTPLTTVSLNHLELGHQAVSAFSYLMKNPTVISVSIKVECKLHIRASSGSCPENFAYAVTTHGRSVPQIDFYDDDEVQEALSVENFINRCDELDLQILDGLFKHTKYSQLSEALYLADNALKYRIRRMVSWLHLRSRPELVALLSSYLSEASLQEAGVIKAEADTGHVHF
ncbi:MAG: substrate-binding domain-containing protein [Bacillota bacterium]|nr:substrate-binding domain-containing protein [Bacillota bacterium]